jgi:hypothetical protein
MTTPPRIWQPMPNGMFSQCWEDGAHRLDAIGRQFEGHSRNAGGGQSSSSTAFSEAAMQR